MKDSPYLELILYMKSLIIMLESLDKPDTSEDSEKLSISMLNSLRENIDSLIEKIS